MPIKATLLQMGYKVNNYIEDATDTGAGNDKFDSTTLMEFECPANTRWYLIGMVVNRDASATLTVDIRDTADKIILHLDTDTANTGITSHPSTKSNKANLVPPTPIILDEGEYVNVAFGAAQGAGAYASCVVIEVRMGED